MATVNREEFTSQLEAGKLAWLRGVAGSEGREFHEVLEDAIDVYRKHLLQEILGPEGFAHLEVIMERMGRYQRMRETKTE